MGLTIEETHGSIHRVTWRINCENKTSGQINKTIPFARFFAHFDISCTYNEINPVEHIFNAEFRLKQLESSTNNESSTSSEDRETLPDYYREPCAVWITDTNDQKQMFKRQSDGWEIKTNIKVYTDSIWASIFIQFNTFSEISVLLQHLTDIYVNQSNCDIQFCFQDDRKIGGHVSVLAARSPVFAAMFNHDMKEKQTGEVVIEDIEFEIFQELLHYIYSGRMKTVLTEATARSLCVAADKYDVPGLKEECTRALLFDLKRGKAFDLLVWADLHSVEKVKKEILTYVAKHFKTICQTDDWEAFILNYPHLCLLVTRNLM
ncbi:speckle-type POZ protein-like [Daphnia pulex]|uniref:speckle-type POZ protein-like n=1 Tax=Daphnia pulex TaxID=6669 RepID=UPI001EDFE571|nr:speckle-type POZ protein-like [Daphnia pulex]